MRLRNQSAAGSERELGKPVAATILSSVRTDRPLEYHPVNHSRFFVLLLSLIATAWGQGHRASAIELPETARREGVKPRNVVFVLTDDHRFDAMGFMGHPFLETPHLDSLAANGVHVKNAFVTTSLCSPSRASILTGLYTHKHRVIDNNRLVPEGTHFLSAIPAARRATKPLSSENGTWAAITMTRVPAFDHWVSFRGQGNYLAARPEVHAERQRCPREAERDTSPMS